MLQLLVQVMLKLERDSLFVLLVCYDYEVYVHVLIYIFLQEAFLVELLLMLKF